MTDAITTLTAGLQQSVSRVNTAASQIANPQNFVPSPARASGQASDFASPSNGSESIAAGSLEASVVSLKVAAQSYKANAEALTSILENQKEAFERLI